MYHPINKLTSQGVKYHILHLVCYARLVPSKGIASYFAQYNRRVINSALAYLLDNGLVSSLMVMDRKYVRLTSKGLDELINAKGSTVLPTTKLTNNLKLNKQDLERIVRTGESISLAYANDILTLPSQKPSFNSLVEILLNPLLDRIKDVPDDTNNLQISDKATLIKMLKQGIFYSSSEIREIVNLHDKTPDMEMAQTRFSGVIFKDKDYYIVYNTLDRLMRWSDVCEERSIRKLRAIVESSNWEYNGERVGINLQSIVIGKNSRVLVDMVTGLKGGKEKIGKKAKEMATQISSGLFYSNKTMYRAMYFVMATGEGSKKSLRNIIDEDEVERSVRYQEFYKAHNLNTTNEKYVYGYSKEEGKEKWHIAMITVLDILQLKEMKENDVVYNVIIEKKYVEGIEKVLGEKLRRAMTEGNEVIEFKRTVL